MSALTIPLISLYEYDDTILDGLHVPTAADLAGDVEYIDPIPELSDDDLRMQLLFDLGELSPVYSDPELLKRMVEIWGRINRPNWVNLWETALYKYNPIWNKDGSYTDTRTFTLSGETTGTVSYDEDRTRAETGKDTSNSETNTTGSGTSSEQTSGTETKSGTASQNTTHSVTGYNTNALSPASGDNTSGTTGENNSTSGTRSGSTSDTGKEVFEGETDITRNATETTDADTSTSGTQARTENETLQHVEQGNIGVTTTQQMIKEQREIVTFNIYRYIIDAFKKQFMIMVWDI